MEQRFQPLGTYFKEKRLAAGLSQGQLAKSLGFKSPQLISNWERGVCAPPMKAILKMVDILSLSSEEVVDLITETNRAFLMKQLTSPRKRKRA